MEKKGKKALHPIIKLMANMLAFALLALFVTYTEEVEHPIVPTGTFVVEVEYNHLDLPTSVARSQNSKQLKLQRLVFIPASFNLGMPDLFPIISSVESRPQVNAIHPQIFSLLKLVVSSNAP
jgi:hypothetical protein